MSTAQQLATAPRGFFSVPARHAGHVVARASSNGLVWAWRAMRKGDRPSPACLFVPSLNSAHAAAVAACAKAAGLPSQTKPASACAVYRTGPLAASPPLLAVKIRLPSGVSCAVARSRLRASWLNLVRP